MTIARKLERTCGPAFCVHCGGPAAYRAESRWESGHRLRALCEVHGRGFAIRWELELPPDLSPSSV